MSRMKLYITLQYVDTYRHFCS